jgi:hypothetical protein
MRTVELKTVTMQRVSETQMGVIEGKAFVNLDLVCAVIPATIPSEVMGADQQPVGTPAAALLLPGGQIIVRKTYQEMQELLSGDSHVQVS